MTDSAAKTSPASHASPAADEGASRDFVRALIDQDLEAERHQRVVTRFPPEPNGFLHVGHAKSICLNFGLAEEYGAAGYPTACHLRFDDTNPETEDPRYVASIQEDVRWLGFTWHDAKYHASDYFERFYAFAEELVRQGKAYVDDLSEEKIREHRGTVTEAGRPSPYRDRSPEENLDLLRRMREGEFPDGSRVLRAKIDMAHPNMKMRDPLLYRIRHAEHYRRGDRWKIYPMYDFAHCLSDSIEGITHSLCTLEFENNRDIYDWVLENLEVPRPRPHQYEFARLRLTYTVLSKRKLLELVETGLVHGWDDPRMPTLSGLRRRGYTAASIRAFCEQIGVSKANSVVDVGQLEHAIRDDLNHQAPRVLAVLDPLKVVVTNYPEGEEEMLEAPYFPRDIGKEGSRELPFSRELYIERGDFMEEPVKGFRRLAPGREVRLRYAYFLTCDEVVKDPESGEITELRCTYDPETRGGSAPDGRSPKGTIHWVSARHAIPVEARLYDRLFTLEEPDQPPEGRDWKDFLNPDSLEVIETAWAEPSLASAEAGSRFQLERHGYFYVDPQGEPRAAENGVLDGRPVLNRIVPLKDTWARRSRQDAAGAGEAAPGTRKAAKQAAKKPAAAPSPAPPKEPELTADEAETARALTAEHGLGEQDAAVLARHPELAALFREGVDGAAAAPSSRARAVANWVINEAARDLKDRPAGDLPFGGREIGKLVDLIEAGTLSTALAKDVYAAMLAGEGDPEAITAARGLAQVNDDGALREAVEGVLAAHPDELATYREGKKNLFGFFMGKLMQATRGKANPKRATELLRERLEREG